MKAAVLIIMTVVATGCCTGDPTPLLGQDRAVAIVWNEIYGETKNPPPIYWRRDYCGEPNGNYPPLPNCTFNNLMGERVEGTQSNTPWHIEVGAPWGDGKISDTSLAHELLHAAIGDPGHRSDKWDACYVPVGPNPSLWCQAYERLVSVGL